MKRMISKKYAVISICILLLILLTLRAIMKSNNDKVTNRKTTYPNVTKQQNISHEQPVSPDSQHKPTSSPITDDGGLDDTDGTFSNLVAEIENEVVSKDSDLGAIISYQRTDDIINKISKESLQNSFTNLDIAENFKYPGHYYTTIAKRPFDYTEILLSNRRLIKIYSEMAQLPQEEQSKILVRQIQEYQKQLLRLLEKFNLNNAPFTMSDYSNLPRITEIPERGPTFHGTRYAMQSLALLTGMLGNDMAWQEIQKAFKYPVFGTMIDKKKYDPKAIFSLENHYDPLFPDGLKAQVIFLLFRNKPNSGIATGLEELTSKSSQNMISKISIPDFKSRCTKYDIHHRLSLEPIDTSYGVHEFDFLTTNNSLIISRIVDLVN